MLFVLLLGIASFASALDVPTGEGSIRARAGGSEIVITTTQRLAGAIHSLTWNGQEFIDSADHGRQLQSASNLDCGQKFIPEVFNPTEAGSMRDGAGPRSTSVLKEYSARGNELKTLSQMAFWLAPGEKSLGNPARNEQKLSRHLLRKHVRIGYREDPQVLDYEVVFTIPEGEQHTLAQFEALTGYMPAEFSKFWKYRTDSAPGTDPLEALDDGPGEQPYPVIFSTASGGHAMGILLLEASPSRGPGYGRFRFSQEKVTKWNCVCRVHNPQGVPAGEYRFRMLVPVGTLQDVKTTLGRLVDQARLHNRDAN